jgi:conjugal transfer pilus assembly protein TraE
MKSEKFAKTWNGTLSDNAFLKKVVVGLIGAVFFLSLALAAKDRTVVLTPPNLDAQVEISRSKASEGMLTAWGISIAELLGNVTPGTTRFLTKELDPMLAPGIRDRVLDAIAEQVKKIEKEQISISFEPAEARFDQAQNKVYVTGDLVTTNVEGISDRQVRTYAMQFKVQNYRVMLADIAVTAGQPAAPEVAQQ